jgi:predicted phosphodiesterase
VSAPVAVLSDVHGNSPALEAVLQDIDRAGCARVYVLGDVINGMDPGGCLDLLRARDDAVCLRGNAEHYLLTPDLEHFPQREEPLYRAVIALLAWWEARLSAADLAWLEGLPDLLFWDGACLVHDSPVDRLHPEGWHVPGVEDQYQELCYHAPGIRKEMPDDEMETLLRLMAQRALSGVFCGHTHQAFSLRVGSRLVCNVGSAGMPLDGDPRPSWALVRETAEGQQVSMRRVAYDVERILRLVDNAGDYPDFETPERREAYKARLATGRFVRHV